MIARFVSLSGRFVVGLHLNSNVAHGPRRSPSTGQTGCKTCRAAGFQRSRSDNDDDFGGGDACATKKCCRQNRYDRCR